MSTEFELFEKGNSCDTTFPINENRDQFTIVRFASLMHREQLRAAELTPIVITRDVIDPYAIEKVRESLSSLPEEIIKGGVAMKAEWKEKIVPPNP